MIRQRNLLGPQGMGGMVGLWGASSLIASVQRGTFSNGTAASGSSTITAVNPAHSLIVTLGATSNNGGSGQSGDLSQWWSSGFANSTTITWGRGASNGVTRQVSWEVWEFNPGVLKSVQFAAITLNNAAASQTTTITAVNTAKTLMIPSGWQMQFTSTNDDISYVNIQLTNATTQTVTRLTASASQNVNGYMCIAELF